MGRYLDLIAVAANCEKSELIPDPAAARSCEKSEMDRPKRLTSLISQFPPPPNGDFDPALRVLDARCPELIEVGRWRRAVHDAGKLHCQMGRASSRAGLDCA